MELGGWDVVGSWYTPPAHVREKEVAPVTEWAVFLALTSPLLELVGVEAEHVSGDVHLVRAVVANARLTVRDHELERRSS